MSASAANDPADRSLKLFETLASSSPTPSFVMDVDGEFVWVNSRFVDEFGLDVGDSLDGLIHGHDITYNAARAATMCQEIGSETFNVRVRDRDGGYVRSAVHLVAIDGQQGELVAVAGYVVGDGEHRPVDEAVHYDATHDRMTGLFNRHAIKGQLDLQVSRGNVGLGLLFVDLDGFKEINDRFGHGVGDDVLREVARRLRSTTRGGDIVGRLGGDEFLVLCPSAGTVEDLERLAGRILSEVSRPIDFGTYELQPRASVGMALFDDETMGVEQLMADADLAMYEAKRTRQGIVAATPGLRVQARQRNSIEFDLVAALESGEICFHHQAVRCLESGEILGTEALLRWDHPQHGMIAPPIVIERIEATGLIERFTTWSIDQICRDLVEIRRRLPIFHDKQSSLNLTASQLAWSGYAGVHVEALRRHDLRDVDIIVELTETSPVQTGPGSEETLRRLAAANVLIALDDFGVGFNSLSYFTRFSVGAAKIDRSIVTNAIEDRVAKAILANLVDLADRLDIALVAEGIETPEQGQLCVDLGILKGQGYLLGRPMPVAKLCELETEAETQGRVWRPAS